jgi:hypothetical protein
VDLTLAGLFALLGALLLGAIVLTFLMAPRIGRSYDRRRAEREAGMPRRVCSTCRSDMDYAGIRSFTSGDGAFEVESYECPVCRKVDFYLPPAAVEG